MPNRANRSLGALRASLARISFQSLPSVPSRTIKRGVMRDGVEISVSLEAQFWDCLEHIAAREGLPLTALIERIDRARERRTLSSAIRLFVLDDVKARIEPGAWLGSEIPAAPARLH